MKIWDGFEDVMRWLLGMFGWKDNSTWGIVIKRIWGTCLVICAVLFTTVAVVFIVEDVLDKLGIYEREPYSYKGKFVSDRVRFYPGYRHAGALIDEYSKKVLVKDIENVYYREYEKWIVFVSESKAGYMDRETLEVKIPPQYDFAWNYSEEVAAVKDKGKIFFINRDGTKAFEQEFQAERQLTVIAFENGFCLMLSDDGTKQGLIDHQGNWLFQPVYDDIEVCDDGIYVEKDNIKKLYGLDGKTVLNELVIDDISPLSFYDVEEERIATLCIYSSCTYGPYGLITTEGKPITQPIYVEIEAISKDLYLCKPQGGLIDSQGNIIKM